MSMLEMALIIAGGLTLGLSIFHIPQVWRQFFPTWQKEFPNLTLLNRKLINTILVALSMILLVIALITIAYSSEISRGSGLALGLCIGLALFWLWRAVWQWIYFPPSKIERTRMLLFLNYAVVVISILNAVLYSLPVVNAYFQ